MSALNWEQDRSRRMPKDLAMDSPPLTGSFADQARYGVYPAARSRRLERQRTAAQVPSTARDFAELRRYVEHVESADFRRKSAPHRQELLAIVRRLRARCEAQREWAQHEQPLLVRARRVGS